MSNGEPTIRQDNMVAVASWIRAEQRTRWAGQDRENASVSQRLKEHGEQGDRVEKQVSQLHGTVDALSTNVSAILSRPRTPRNGWHQRPMIIGSGGAGVGGAIVWFLAQLIGG